MSEFSELIGKIVKDIDGVEVGNESFVQKWIDTGNYAINKIISGSYSNGLPFGRVVDVFGDPSTGKSLLIYHILANVQKIGGIAILDDTEDAYVKEFGEKIGINNNELIRLSSLTVEEHFEKVFLGWKSDKREKKSLVQSILEAKPDCPIVVALDSLALLSTRHEQEVKFEKPDMVKAKQIRAGLRIASSVMRSGNILHLISNHVTAKIGVMYGKKTTTPGGSGVPFQASVRLELLKGSKIKDDEENILGIESDVYVTKNKVNAPFGRTTARIFFDTGLDKYSGLLEYLVKEKKIEDLGRGNFKLGQNSFKRNSFKEVLENNLFLLE